MMADFTGKVGLIVGVANHRSLRCEPPDEPADDEMDFFASRVQGLWCLKATHP